MRGKIIQTGVVLSGLIFLGSAEISTSSESPESRLALHDQKNSFDSISESIIVEDGEDGEAGFSTEFIALSWPSASHLSDGAQRSSLSAFPGISLNHNLTADNPRGPPIL